MFPQGHSEHLSVQGLTGEEQVLGKVKGTPGIAPGTGHRKEAGTPPGARLLRARMSYSLSPRLLGTPVLFSIK